MPKCVDNPVIMISPEEFIKAIDLEKLPSGPRVLSRLIAVIRQPDVELSAVSELLQADPALTARIVAACNSPYYARGEPTPDLRAAVLRLGLAEVSRIVQIASLTDLQKYPTHLYTNTAGYYWQRSVHTGFVIEQISQYNPAAYTAGIMHLVGIWVLCSVFPAGSLSIAQRELELQAQLEEFRLGVSFALAGGEALAKWGFTPEVCSAVKWQIAAPEDADPEHLALAQILQRAIAIVDWHYGLQNENTLVRSGMTLADLEACNRRAEAKVARVGFGF